MLNTFLALYLLKLADVPTVRELFVSKRIKTVSAGYWSRIGKDKRQEAVLNVLLKKEKYQILLINISRLLTQFSIHMFTKKEDRCCFL